ncbi:MAG: 4-phosphoerythronate dehydrogenase, partial [Rikenellaceae bacterium]
MKIVIDSAIPYINGVFEPFAEVVYCLGADITHDMVVDADALIIRTRTKCNKALLEGSAVKHIATATIGFDHIDLEYCATNNIEVTSAAGCNARAVLHWMAGVLAHLSQTQGWTPEQKRVGIVGVGNVGRLIKEYLEAW